MKASNKKTGGFLAQIQGTLRFLKRAFIVGMIPMFFLYILLEKPDYHVLSAIQRPLVAVATPVANAISWPFRASINFVSHIGDLNRASSENVELRKMLDEKLSTEHQNQILTAENEKLRTQLKMVSGSKHKLVWAEIIHNNKSSLHHNFMINTGSAHGVKPGMIVLSASGELVGTVIQTTDNYSQIKSITDITSSVPVRVPGTNVYGFIRGNNTSKPLFELFSDPSFRPDSGTPIMTSGIRDTFPENIPVGYIGSVFANNTASIKLYAPVSSLTSVQVLLFDYAENYKNITKKFAPGDN